MCTHVFANGKQCSRPTGHAGRHFPALSEEAIANHAEANRKMYADPEFRAKHAAAMKGSKPRLLVCKRGLHDLTDPANVQENAKGRQCKPCLVAQKRQHRLENLEAERDRDRRRWPKRRDQALAYAHEKHLANPDAMNDRNRQRLYGLEPGGMQKMLTAQGGRCALCRTDAPQGKGWHVDHDHETKAVRGILCHKCNVGLGLFDDSYELMLAGARYLKT